MDIIVVPARVVSRYRLARLGGFRPAGIVDAPGRRGPSLAGRRAWVVDC